MFTVTMINPDSGLPMLSGIGGVDVAGNPYGIDSSGIDTHSLGDDFIGTNVGMDDSFMDPDIGGTSMDDPFS